ncbi:MAG: chloride channel protein [SAR324 cluster bacterium]|nr:chloride channel protein [SAR324 cluster bacterium]
MKNLLRNSKKIFIEHFLNSETDKHARSLSRFTQVSALEAGLMMVFALVLGLVSGALSVALNYSVHLVSSWSESVSQTSWGVLLPAVGAGVAVFLIRHVLRDQSGHGVPDVIKSVTLGSKFLPRRMLASRFLGSLLTVGTGGSAGLEGPIVCVGGSAGVVLGQLLKMNERHKKLLISYGVAGAIAGVFNAPLTGMIFTLEVILREWSYLTILPTIIAAVSATELSRVIMGNKIPFYHEISTFSINSLIACVVLGVVTGVMSAIFMRMLSFWHEIFQKISRHSWIQAIVGGLMVGGLGFFMPEVLAEGYPMIQQFLVMSVSPELSVILLFLVMKMLACCFTLSSGGVGGTFAPSLVLGSGIGYAFGIAMYYLPITDQAGVEAFSLVGMAGMVSGVMHSPLTGIFLVMESTRGYSLVLPLMLTASSSMLVSYALGIGSIYTRELIARGDLVRKGSDAYLLHSMNMHEILDKDCISIDEGLLLGEFIEIFKKAHRNYFPVMQTNSTACIGVVFLDDIRSYLFNQNLYDLVTMGSVMRKLPQIEADLSINEALEKFEESHSWSLPVVDRDGVFLGMLSKSTLFNHYRRELQLQND